MVQVLKVLVFSTMFFCAAVSNVAAADEIDAAVLLERFSAISDAAKQPGADKEAILQEYRDLSSQLREVSSSPKAILRNAPPEVKAHLEGMEPQIRSSAELLPRMVDFVDKTFISEKTAECIGIIAAETAKIAAMLTEMPIEDVMDEFAAQGDPREALLEERVLDIKHGSTRDESAFACMFLQVVMQAMAGLPSTAVDADPRFAERFDWINDAAQPDAEPFEWLIYDATASEVALNVVGEQIIISRGMSEALVDVAVVAVFSDYETFEESQSRFGNGRMLEALGEQSISTMIDLNNPETREEAHRDAMKQVFGDKNPLEIVGNVLRGQPVEMPGTVFGMFGDEQLEMFSRFQPTLEGLLRFAMLHELGHIAAGHADQSNPTCAERRANEFEADALALSILMKMSRTNTTGISLVSQDSFDKAGFRAFFDGFAAFDFDESGGCDHPPASERLASLETQFSEPHRGAAQAFRDKLLDFESTCMRVPEMFRAQCSEMLAQETKGRLSNFGFGD